MVFHKHHNSPAYFVYHPDTNKALQYRLVKFVTKIAAEKQTQTSGPEEDFQPKISEAKLEVVRSQDAQDSGGIPNSVETPFDHEEEQQSNTEPESVMITTDHKVE